MKRFLAISSLLLIAGIGALLYPVYQFFAHRGVAPLPPWGWEVIETAAPETREAINPAFTEAGDRALTAMSDYRKANGLPSLSAAVAIDGEPVWAGTVGFADIAANTPATPQTRYRIGSTSKALTGTALARLMQRGAIDIDQPITDYAASAQNPMWVGVTARQLASHSAGTPHYGENKDTVGLYRSIAMWRHYDDVRDALTIFDQSPLLFEPGTQFHYSSLGTVLLGAVMSDVTDAPYRDLMVREVFEPAGMENTSPDSEPNSRTDNLAKYYYTDGSRFREWRPIDLSHRLPGGGYVSSPLDLVRVGKLYFGDESISPETRATLWTPQQLADGNVNEQNYALGWRWSEFDFDDLGVVGGAHHGGVSRGSQCWLLMYPDYRLSTAFCTNTKTESFATFGGFFRELFRAFAEDVPTTL